jgi:HEAT repeat protein
MTLILILFLAEILMDDNVEKLVAGLASNEPKMRIESAEKLAKMGSSAQPAAPALARRAGDEVEEVAQWVTSALEELGPPLASDAEVLAEMLRDQSPDVGYWAATLLGRLGSEAAPAAGALADAMAVEQNPAVRQRAAWALGKVGSQAESCLESLRQAASDADPRLARLASRAIEQIGGN